MRISSAAFMRRSKAANHWPWIVIVVQLILSFGGMTWRPRSARETGHAGQRRQNLRLEPSVLSPASKQLPTGTVHQDQPKLLRTGSKARVRVRPGETAVMGYYEIAPGKLGLTMVTPTAVADGHVLLAMRTLEISDSEEFRSQAQDILPDVFDLERSGVISEKRLNELLRSVLNNPDAKTVSYPGVTTAPGQACSIKNGVNEPGGEFTGVSYALQADSIQDGEGFDLSVDFNRSGKLPEE
jgi:hypothetical protein